MPGYVKAYWDAQWWVFLHWSVPVICVALVLAAVYAIAQYREDNHIGEKPFGDGLSISDHKEE